MSSKTKKVTVFPRMKIETSGNTDISVKPRWIDLDNVNVPFYGLKFYVPPSNVTTGYTEMFVRCDVYFVCKNRV